MALVLTLISVAAGGCLAYVNHMTEGPIAEINKKNLEDGIKKVLTAPEASVLRTDTVLDDKQKVAGIIYTTDKGIAVQATDHNGFGGDLAVLVGFDEKGNIKGYTILESHETPGLGQKAGDWFQASGKGNIIGMNPDKNHMTVSKDGGEVDAITASTITSRAFLRAVCAAYEEFKTHGLDASTGATTH